jgi:hypothetical protein
MLNLKRSLYNFKISLINHKLMTFHESVTLIKILGLNSLEESFKKFDSDTATLINEIFN